MSTSTVRVRFAPAPTGMMHLGNVRTALFNYLLARQTDGTFILRIEDTDTERNYDPNGIKIMEDLAWLGLHHDEGPDKDGGYGPYLQSQRTHLYTQVLDDCMKKGIVYRCFCSTEELERKRERQIALKLAPRYDRFCLNLSAQESEQKAAREPFVWRAKIDHSMRVTIKDMARGTVTFDLKNFSDFPLTRQDGSFTFMFANFVDDYLMKITHVIRGEDHLTNTAGQAFLYLSLGAPLPIFYHMPILCNTEGKKLSKRDFGFSLRDLKDGGFLPQAIDNYLALLGGSFEEEIMSLEALVQKFSFENISSNSQIRYDVEKLRWLNHKWLMRLPLGEITALCIPHLRATFQKAADLTPEECEKLVAHFHQELVVPNDIVPLTRFYFEQPALDADTIKNLNGAHYTDKIDLQKLAAISDAKTFVETLKENAKRHDLKLKEFFSWIRYALTGSVKGLGIGELVELLGVQEVTSRLRHASNK